LKLEGRHVLLVLACALVAGAIGGGVYIMGSPANARRQRLDERRVDDLRSLASSVDAYWSRRQRLPETLNELVQVTGVVGQMNDPVTGVQYEYRTSGPDRCQLCAVFAGSSADPGNFWSHPAGRQCFDIVVDKIRR
jgi:hypothetical protein